MAEPETRVAPRKVLRCRAKVMLSGGRPPMMGRTVDISLSGICIMLEAPLPAGESCVIAFEASVNGTMRRVMASAKIVYSIFSGEGFRIGLQFVQLDAANTSIINEIVR
ncbi:MAG: PilZ domain-containing protein [Burkholderiaceae bacterium]